MARAAPNTYYPDPNAQFWVNDRYTVIQSLRPDQPERWMWLSVRRNDRKPIRDWRDLQRIKNDIAGPEREAIELFPAERRLVDTSNQYHLWVLPAGEVMPVGFDKRVVSDDEGRMVVDGVVMGEDEVAAKIEALGIDPAVIAQARQRPRE